LELGRTWSATGRESWNNYFAFFLSFGLVIFVVIPESYLSLFCHCSVIVLSFFCHLPCHLFVIPKSYLSFFSHLFCHVSVMLYSSCLCGVICLLVLLKWACIFTIFLQECAIGVINQLLPSDNLM
jgi:hypothetical protein